MKKMNVQHRTPNVECRIMMSLRSSNYFKNKKQYRTFNHAGAWFLFSRFDTRNKHFNQFICFIFFHSTFDVGRSMFDVYLFKHLPQYIRRKNNLALMPLHAQLTTADLAVIIKKDFFPDELARPVCPDIMFLSERCMFRRGTITH